MADYLLEIKKLTVVFKTQRGWHTVVKEMDLSIKKSETLALVGESGSGKSMTALAIMQLLPPSAHILSTSDILLEKHNLLFYPEIKMRKIRGRRIGMVFQEAMTALNPVMTIGKQIFEVFNCHFKFSRKEKKIRALQLLDEVGIPDPYYHLHAYPHQLSGGLRQRAMIAIALAGEPELLIADEPTTALDVTHQAQVLTLLQKIQQNRGMGLLFITHDLGVVYQMAHQVAVLHNGKIVESAAASDFFTHPQDPYSQKLFAALPGWVQRPPQLSQKPVSETILQVNNLKVYFPIRKGIFKRTIGFVKAVDDISFDLKKGQTLALVGESGSGKTSTGMAVLRLAPVTAGRIQFQGIDLASLSASELRRRRHDFQVVFQDPYASMNPRMLIKDIIVEGMTLHNAYNTEEKKQQRIDDLLMHVGLMPEAKYRYPHEFSGGQRQRICIARALAPEPKLLVCDEPTSALDISSQMQVLQLLLKLQQELNLSYLLITHNLAVVAYMAHEVAVMYQGKIVEKGSVQEVLQHPQHPYTQELLAAVPKVPDTQ
jgi:peptide/nickel transport system ATP-binding protein